MSATTKPDVTEAMRQLVAVRGYVVLSFTTKGTIPEIGSTEGPFCDYPITDCEFTLRSETDRKDWDAQCLALHGSSSGPKRGTRYFRCDLISTLPEVEK